MQQQPVQQQPLPPAAWAPHAQQQFPMHIPAMVPQHLLVNMSMPAHQGTYPALTTSAGHEG
eukprot:8929051-Prorocentrum_lima.AAC.1